MHVFVTGATGFVGSWLVKKLLEQGHNVDVLVRKPSALTLKHPNLNVFKGDITKSSTVEQMKENTDVVYHLAGFIAYRKKDRPMMDKVNVEGTKIVVDTCIKKNIGKLIHMSSTCAVGVSFDGKNPLTEKSKFNIKNLNFGYFETKRLAEEYVLKKCNEGLINATVLNPSTIYGAGDAEKGSRGIQLKVAKGKFPFYPPGGVNIIGIDEVVDCLIKSVKLGKNGERYILSGENITIKSLFESIAEAAGKKKPSIKLPKLLLSIFGSIGDIVTHFGGRFPISGENAKISSLYHWFDSSKAQKEFNFTPKPAKVYIKNSIDWVLANKI